MPFKCSFLRFQTAYKYPDFKNLFFQRENSSSGAINTFPVEGVIFFLKQNLSKKKEELSKKSIILSHLKKRKKEREREK